MNRPLLKALSAYDSPVSDQFREDLELSIRDYESVPGSSSQVAASLRSMPPRAASWLLLVREAARRTRGWDRGSDAATGNVGPLPEGVLEFALEDGIEADVYQSEAKRGKVRDCASCGGRRWLRKVVNLPEGAEIGTNPKRTTHYATGETYLVPCDSCSRFRRDAFYKEQEERRKGRRATDKREAPSFD